MILYYITDRMQFSGSETERRRALLDQIGQAASAGVDYIQLREKDLPARELEELARKAVRRARESGERTRVLINSRMDIALAVGADGVHLTAADVFASDARAVWAHSQRQQTAHKALTHWVIGVSCHSVGEVRLAESHGADFAVLAPVFEKPGTSTPPLGLGVVRAAARKGEAPDRRVEAGEQRVVVPVLALGGVTLKNAPECLRAGASGI
ncbi:MAG: thiamine phosphate synthase, partial [Acidobacteriaceae bacterium]